MLDLWHDLTVCRSVRPQFVSDDALGGLCVPAGLNDLIANMIILFNRAPKPIVATERLTVLCRGLLGTLEILLNGKSKAQLFKLGQSIGDVKK